MTKEISPEILANKVIVSGIHIHLTEALKEMAASKASRLLRHNDHIIRIRIDIEHDKTRDLSEEFIAKGHIEISGPDLVASAASDDAYKSLDLLVNKLDRLLYERHSRRVGTRTRNRETIADIE